MSPPRTTKNPQEHMYAQTLERLLESGRNILNVLSWAYCLERTPQAYKLQVNPDRPSRPTENKSGDAQAEIP
jgi:hypothetical protein